VLDNKAILSMNETVVTYKLRIQMRKHASCTSFLLLRMTAHIIPNMPPYSYQRQIIQECVFENWPKEKNINHKRHRLVYCQRKFVVYLNAAGEP